MDKGAAILQLRSDGALRCRVARILAENAADAALSLPRGDYLRPAHYASLRSCFVA